jgi:threonine/homoserine/homoserine lactone efflux protein
VPARVKHMHMDISLLLRGLILGVSIAAPVGPIGLLCIKRTLVNGRAHGLVSGLGAATADGIYGLLGALGITVVINALTGAQLWLRLIGGLFLLYLGLRMLRERPAERAASVTARAGLLGAYGSTLALTLSNPLTILSFAAMFAGMGALAATADALLLVLGVFAGSALWWMGLSTVVSRLRTRMSSAYMRWLNIASGTIIIAFAVYALGGLFFGPA